MSADEGSFFSRWSRRKAQSTSAPAEPRHRATAPAPQHPPEVLPGSALAARAQDAPAGALPDAGAAPAATPAHTPAATPPPTLDDVALLTRESDYSRFIAADVAPQVRHAALRKLFSDPQFNVMDGLDTYVDDYHAADPLPAGMLRRMVQSQMLGLFADEAPATGVAHAGAAGAPMPLPTPAGTAAPAIAPSPTEPTPDEDADLQLQPDDDAGRAGLAPGAGSDAGCQH